MTREYIVKCDRCNYRASVETVNSSLGEWRQFKDITREQDFDLCKNCAEDFNIWWDAREKA